MKEMDNYKTYDTYKPSGVEWLGDIPAHWEIEPGFTFIEERKEKNKGLIESTVLSLSYGNIIIKPEEKLTGLVPESFETYQLVYPGDIIIRPTDLQNDKTSLRTALAKNKGIITNAYINLKIKRDYSTDYYKYFFYIIDITKMIYGLGSGLRQNITYLDFKRFKFLIPPKEEQTRIASFLDEKTALIEKGIEIKQKQIELLKERRQILIHNAVTRGLNPHVKMKPSGVEWIGEIPEHWEVKRLKDICQMIVSNVDKHSKPLEYPVKLCNYVNVYKNDFITDEIDFMDATATKDEIYRFSIKVNDVIITKDSEDWLDIGVPALVKFEDENLICGYHLAILRPKEHILGCFLHRALLSLNIRTQFSVKANGVTRYGISHSAILGVFIVIPPIQEQVAISEHIETMSSKISTTISFKEREIEKLKEYKATMINSVVTGKVKI